VKSGRRCADLRLAADLNDADNLAVEKNRRADHFLDCARGSVGDFYALENRGVAHGSKLFSISGGSREPCVRRGPNYSIAEQNRHFQGFRDQEMQVAPARGNRQDGNLVILTPRFLAIFSDTVEREISIVPPSSVPRALAIRSISETRFRVVLIFEEKYCCRRSQERFRPSEFDPSRTIFGH